MKKVIPVFLLSLILFSFVSASVTYVGFSVGVPEKTNEELSSSNFQSFVLVFALAIALAFAVFKFSKPVKSKKKKSSTKKKKK